MKNHFIKICMLLYVLCLLSTRLVSAQFHNMKFEYLTVDDGLSNNRIRCTFRDSKGFLWIGTEMGLNKYDGSKITVYESVASKANSLLGNDVHTIFEDKESNLWIGTNDGLNLFNRRTETFKHFLSSEAVNSISEDKAHHLWITTNNGINKLTAKGEKIVHYSLGNTDEPEKNTKYLVGEIDKDGLLWLVDYSDKLLKFDPQTGKIAIFRDKRLEKTILEKCIKIDQYGVIWIGTKGNGLFRFDGKSQQFNTFEINTTGTGTSGKSIYSLALDGDQHLLIAVNQSGINRLNVVNKTFEYHLYKSPTGNGLNNENLKCIYKDVEGILWIGTGAGGVNIHNPKKNRFSVYRHNETAKNSVASNAIFRFFEDPEGLIWIGTDGGGLSVFNPVTKYFTNYQHNPSDPYSIGSNSVLGITEDKNHNIWVGCWGGGLNRFDRKSGRFHHYLSDPKDSTSISSNDVWDVKADDKGNLWLSYYALGLDFFDIHKGVIRKYRNNPSDTNSLKSANILSIQRRSDNKYGFVSDIGYFVFDEELNSFKQFKEFNTALFDVFVDRNKNDWVATKGSGLWIKRPNGIIEKYNQSNGFPSNTFCGILEDNNGNIWISSYAGITEYLADTKSFRHFTVADGLQGTQFTSFARLKASDGTLYFGGYNGFNSFHPDSIRTNLFIPKVYFNEFQIFNKLVTTDTPNTVLKQSIEETSEIVLSHKQTVFSFGFNAINYTYPEKAIYAYKMEGYDNDWSYTDYSRRFATYTNLDPGNYVFMVKATNNDGIWNEVPTKIAITIHPPWWKTWWLRSMAIILLSAFMVAFYRIRIANLKRAKKQLEQNVMKRTNELKIANLKLAEHADDLQKAYVNLENKQIQISRQKEILEMQNQENLQITKQLNEANQVKNRFITNISHEFRTPLTLILGPLDSLIASEKNNNRLIEKLTILKRNANRLLRLVNQLLELRNLDSESISIHLEEQDFVLLIRNIYSSFKLKAEQKNIIYTLSVPKESVLGLFDAEKIDKIIFNLLSNAFKFTPEGGRVSINLELADSVTENQNEKQIIVEVTDTGIGIAKKDIAHVFDRFFQSDSSLTRVHKGSGVGLALTKELVDILSGSITAKSEPGIGSSFRLILPFIHRDNGSEQEMNQTASVSLNSNLTEKIFENRFSNQPVDGIKILVVEDNLELRHYLVSILKEKFIVYEANNGITGLEKTKEILPDLIISDVMMPEMDGFQFCEQLKMEWLTSHIPIILLTANADPMKMYHGLEIGADAYITKPFEIQHLITQMESLVSNRKRLMEKFSLNQPALIGIVSGDSSDKDFVNKALALIEENLPNPLFGVEFLADKMNMSRSLLYKKFMTITNMSVGEIIRNSRMEMAAKLLTDKRFSIYEVAIMVGFTDRPQFTRSFTSKYGVGPKQYQQKSS